MIVFVHNLRNRLFLPDHGLADVPLMVSVRDIMERPYLERSICTRGLKAHLGVRGQVLVDSGGFSSTFSRRPRTQLDALISLYKGLDADVLAALDVPPGPSDTRSTRASKWQATLKNLDRMMSKLRDARLMPVIHGSSLSDIERACSEVRQRTGCPKVVALGGMVPYLRGHMPEARFKYLRADGIPGTSAEFVADALALCKSSFPRSRVHVFGVGSPTTAVALLALGADSVDSLAWRRAAGYGTIFLPGCAERLVSARDRIHSSSRPNLSRRDRSLLRECECPMCCQHSNLRARLRALSRSYIARSVHNVWTLLAEQRALRSAKAGGHLDEFLRSRIHGRHRFSSLIRERPVVQTR
jgi:tRNA-guanine family transglycosylase